MQDQARIPWIIRLAFDLDNTAQPCSGTSPHPHEQKSEVNLYVGNLDFDVAEDYLRELFGRYGLVDQVALMRDHDTGRSRGFAFVEMANTNDGDKAIKELDGDQFAGRILRVSEARPRAERRGNRSPFDRGGYRRRSA